MIDAERFLDLFPPGRRNAFGQHDGKRAFTVKSTPTPFVVRQHLQGRSRLGLYPLDAEGRVSWAVLDLDDAGVSAVEEITRAAQKWGLRLAVERSKSKGWHLWLFFSEAVPAAKARAALRGIVHAAGWGEWNFEIFPKQSQLKGDAFGNYLFMPWNGESVKEGRTVFVDTTKNQWPPVPDQAGYVRQFPRYTERDLDDIIRTWGLPRDRPPLAEKPDAGNADARPSGATDLPLPPCAAKIYQEGTASPGRSDWAHFLARHFRRRGLPKEAVVRLLIDWNQRNRPEPLPPDKVSSMVRNAYAKSYTSLGCETLSAARAICGDRCPVKVKEARVEEDHYTPEVVLLADVRPEKIAWLWPGRLPRGKFVVLIGDPGVGKSTICVDIMARVTRGGDWPDGGQASQGTAVLLTAEDGLADTVRPRMDAAGGDPSRVCVLRSMKDQGGRRMFSIGSDLADLERLVHEHHASLVVVDPVSAYLGKVDSFRDSDIRMLLAPLAEMAERTGTTVVGVMHLNKKEQKQIINRAQGSIAFVASARAVFGVVKDKDVPGRVLFLSIKMNVGKEPSGLSYRFQEAENGTVRLAWDPAPVHVTADDAFAVPPPEDKSERDRAEEFLRELLADGRVPSKVVVAVAEKAGIAQRTLWRAKDRIGVKASRAGGVASGGEWGWTLP